jgi:hypothetical protein
VLAHHEAILTGGLVQRLGEGHVDNATDQRSAALFDALVELAAAWQLKVCPDKREISRPDLQKRRGISVIFLAVDTDCDVLPTMHTVIVHYGDLVRRHASLPDHCCEGLEAAHQARMQTP